MKINEIFYSISGESIAAGYPTIFIRTFGCPLRCSWCDSLYAVEGKDFQDMSVDDILSDISQYNCKRVILTGGEPVIQKDFNELLQALFERDYHVEIETSGAVDLCAIHVGKEDEDRCTVTMDWKCPSSGMTSRMIEDNLQKLTSNDVLKCVVGSLEDLDEMKRISALTSAHVFVSPVFGMIEPKDIVQYLLDNNLTDVRFQLQIHKFVWSADKRGV